MGVWAWRGAVPPRPPGSERELYRWDLTVMWVSEESCWHLSVVLLCLGLAIAGGANDAYSDEAWERFEMNVLMDDLPEQTFVNEMTGPVLAALSLDCETSTVCERSTLRVEANCPDFDCDAYEAERSPRDSLQKWSAVVRLRIEDLGLSESDFEKGDTFTVQTEVTVAMEEGAVRSGDATLEIEYNGPEPESEPGCGGCDGRYQNRTPVGGSLVLVLLGFAALRVRSRRGQRWN